MDTINCRIQDPMLKKEITMEATQERTKTNPFGNTESDQQLYDMFKQHLNKLSIEQLTKINQELSEAKMRAEKAGETKWYQKIWGAIKRFFESYLGGALIGGFAVLLVGLVASQFLDEDEEMILTTEV
jgi:hypothetical protein